MSSRRAPVLPAPTPPRAHGAGRLHHLDALRGGALLLGVLLHALMPYLPGNPWLVSDRSQSWLAGGAVGVIHLFRMMLFMMLAGYFGHLVLQRRGAGGFLRDRAVRIGLPLVAFWPGLMALMVLALGLNQFHGAVPRAPAGPAGSGGSLVVPTMHLWFLLLLMEIVVVVVVARAVLVRMLGRDRAARLAERVGAALSTPWGLLLMAVPYWAGLLAQPGPVMGLTEPYTLMPVAGASIGYGGAFLVGWFLRARPAALAAVEQRWLVHLVLALVLSPLALWSGILVPPPLGAAMTAVAGWAWVLALTGLCARGVRREIPWVRYLADSSYWVYLMHFPLLLLAALPMSHLDLPVAVELVAILAVVMAVLLVSYDVCVRPTWIGAWLNGRRRPRALRGRAPATEGAGEGVSP